MGLTAETCQQVKRKKEEEEEEGGGMAFSKEKEKHFVTPFLFLSFFLSLSLSFLTPRLIWQPL